MTVNKYMLNVCKWADLEARVSHGGEGLAALAGHPGVLHHLLQAQPRLRLLCQYLHAALSL